MCQFSEKIGPLLGTLYTSNFQRRNHDFEKFTIRNLRFEGLT